jgi:hypothetical protein
MKLDLVPSVPPETGQRAQNMKTGRDALGSSKTSPGVQIIKGPDALGIAQNEYGNAELEN